MAQAVKRWCGVRPVMCNFCGHKFNPVSEDKYFYDVPITDGTWGLSCENCFRKYGRGLGTGRGQKYNLVTMRKEV